MLSRVISMIIVFVFAACTVQQSEETTALTALDSLNLKMLPKENVAVLGSPPLIPANHEVVIGEDVRFSVNGGAACLDCHGDEEQSEDVPQTLHPERHNCMQCHIPAAEESATEKDFKVENRFDKHRAM